MTAAIGADVGRTEDRQGFDTDVRLRLVEHDLDKADDQFRELVAEMVALRKVLTGILVAIVTGSLLLAINVVVIQAGP